MKEDLVTQFYFISNVTGSYLQSTITEMSNEALVFSFSALIILVFLVYFLQMRRGTSKGLKKTKTAVGNVGISYWHDQHKHLPRAA